MLEELLKQLAEENQACSAKIESLEQQKVEAEKKLAVEKRMADLLIEVEEAKKKALADAAVKLKAEAKTA